jgi:sensor histidine kinase YesM
MFNDNYSLEFKSTPGQGTRVDILIPACDNYRNEEENA